MGLRRTLLARMAPIAVGVGLALSAGAIAAPVLAGEPTVEEKAGARAAAEQGNSAFKAGKYVEALDLFRRAESLLHAPTHVLMIARTYAALGQLVAAKEAFLQVGRDALAPSAPAAFKKAQADAKAEVAALEPRIPTIHLTARGGGSKRVEITMDGKPVPDALIGIVRPIDPGAHVFRAAADGMQPDERSVTVQEKDRLTLVLELKPGSAPAATPVAPAPAPSQDPPNNPYSAPTPTTDPPPPPDEPSSPLRAISIGVIGLGAVGLGVGTVFAILGKNKRSDADAAYAQCGDPCPEDRGGPEVRKLDDDATAKSTVGVISLVGGGALVATGVVLLIVSGSSSSSTKSARVSPWVGPGSAGVAGRF